MKLEKLISESTYAVDRLKKYVYDASMGFLSKGDISELLSEYPTDKKYFVYRGLFFDNVKIYNKFITEISNNRIELKSFSSWTRSKSTAFQFSMTKPTNNIMLLGRSFFKGEDLRKSKKEYTQGYGVILAMVIPAGKGIDVNTVPDVGQEDEIIAPAGKYVVKIIKTYKPHGDSVKSIVDINKWVQSQRGMKAKWEKDIDYSMMQYILHNFEDGLNDKSRRHIYNLFSGSLNSFKWKIHVPEYPPDEYGRLRSTDEHPDKDSYHKKALYEKPDIRVEVYTKNLNYNLFYYMPLYLPSDVKRVNKFIDSKMDELIYLLKKYRDKYQDDYFVFFEMQGFRSFSKFASKDSISKVNKIVNGDIGKIYRDLNSKKSIDNINSLSGVEQRDAIYNMVNNMKKLFNKMA